MSWLPDVPEDEYRQYQAEQFQQATDQQIGGFGAEQAMNQQIATLQPVPIPPTPDLSRIGAWAQPAASLQPPPEPAPQPEAPAPAPEPPAESPTSPPETPAPSAPVTAPFQAPPTSPTAPVTAPLQAPALTPSPAPAQDQGQADWTTGLHPAVQQVQDWTSGLTQQAGSLASSAGQQASDWTTGLHPSQQPQPEAPSSDWTTGLTQPAATSSSTAQSSISAPQAGAIDSSSPAAFARTFAPYAQYAAAKLGVDPAWITAMAASESNYGKAPGNELFGIKALPGQKSQSLSTHEGEYGGSTMNQDFAAYDSPLESVDAYVNLLAKHYPGAVGAKDLPTFVHGLKQGGYFTAAEPEYLGILQSISNRVGPDVSAALSGQPQQAVSTNDLLQRTGGWTTPKSSTLSNQSQFGDPQLSADEAYAACGPAAAVRFAQLYGRNPTLREATDLATSVGWTSASGMAGISSEQKLMDKMGVSTKLVGPDIQAMAREAQTGNPITISTTGHYFTADNYDPQTGAFHVGQSGLDLRGGSEWMTPQQMEAKMGAIQGALFADNPRVPADSTASGNPILKDTWQPAGWGDAAKSTLGNIWTNLTGGQDNGGLGRQPTDVPSSLGAARDQLTSLPQQAGSLVPSDLGQPVSDLGSTANRAINSLPDTSDLLTVDPNTPLGQIVSGKPVSSLSITDQAQALMQLNQQYSHASETATERINPARDVPVVGGLINQSTNPEFWLTAAGAGAAGEAAGSLAGGGLRSALAKGATEGALFNAATAAQQPGASAEDIALGAGLGAGIGAPLGAAGYGVSRLRASGVGQNLPSPASLISSLVERGGMNAQDAADLTSRLSALDARLGRAPTAADPYDVNTLMRAYEQQTPARIASIQQRVQDYLAPYITPSGGDQAASRQLISQIQDAGRQLLADSRVTATGLSEKAAAALADTGLFTNKLNSVGQALDSAKATRSQVGPSRVNIDQAADFVRREAAADNMALGSTQALDDLGVRDPDALNRVYAYTSAGPPLIGPQKPAMWVVWEDGAPRVVTAHHHYGIGSPDADIHATTPEGLKSLMWSDGTVAGDRVDTPSGPAITNWQDRGLDVGGGRRIANTDALVGPSGENDMRMATALASMPQDVQAAIRSGQLTDPAQIASILLRESPPQSAPAITAAKRVLGVPPGAGKLEEGQYGPTTSFADEVKQALAISGVDNGKRTESLMVDPQLRHVKAIYIAGTPEDLEAGKTMANVKGRSRLQLAQAVRQQVKDQTGKDVPILFKDITPHLNGREPSLPSKLISDTRTIEGPDIRLAPGRQRIVSNYTRAGYPNVGILPRGQTLARLGTGAVYGGVGGGYSASQQEGATPQSIALGALGGAASGALQSAVGRVPTGVTAQAVAKASSPALDAIRKGRTAVPDDTVSLPDRMRGAWASINRQLFDRGIDLANLQQEYAKAIGRPLNADEMVYELSRLASDPAAEVRVQRGLRPAVQSVGDDYEHLVDLLTARSNVQVSDSVGQDLMRELADQQVPAGLRDALNNAKTSLRMRQQNLDSLLNQTVQDPQRIASAKRSVQGATRALKNRQDAYDAANQQILQNASQQGAEAAANRMFSGGVNREMSQQAIQDLEQQLGPERYQRISDAADQISDFGRSLRQRLVESGTLSQDQADEMDLKYPDWVKTKILDYMDQQQGGQGAGTSIGLGSRDVHAYTQAGTDRVREDPIASMVAYAHQVERMARKNETFNAMLNIDKATGKAGLRQVTQDFSPTSAQGTIQGFVNGEKQKYVTDNKALANAVQAAGSTQLPDWMTAWSRLFRNLATSRNPVFLAGNAALDIPEYVIRSMVREGGNPTAMPRILSELAKGYGDAFQGITRGEFAGENTQRYLLGGGGESGAFSSNLGGTPAEISKRAEDITNELRRTNAFQVNSASDLRRLVTDMATLKPVSALGERVEMGPRVAAMRLAERRGMNPVQSVIQGRDVTLDFNQGGQATKLINQLVPFFNVGFQGPAQVARAFGENRGGFVKTVGSLIGLPTVSAEIWNNRDPQTAADYADVPQNLKDTGLIFMLPGEAPRDAQGNRQPQYAYINLRNWAPFATMARTAVDKAMGYNGSQRDFGDLASSVWAGTNPISSGGPANLMQRFAQGVPGLSAAAQIAIDRDIFRNRYIATDRGDQSASQLAKDVTPLVQTVAPNARPSQVDFALRDQLAGTGGSLMSAYDLIRGAPQNQASAGPQTIPVVGGLAGRFVRGQGGEVLQQAQQARLTPSAQRTLSDNGIRYTPSTSSATIDDVPLRREEQAQLQQLQNRYVDDELQKLFRSPSWARASKDTRDQMVRDAAGDGEDKAKGEIMRQLGSAEARRRRAAKSAA